MRYKNEQAATSGDNDNIIEWVFPVFKNIFQHNLLYEDGMKFRVDDQLAACLRIHTPSKKRHKFRCFIVPEDAIALWLNRSMPHLNLHSANIMVAPRQR